MNLNQIMDTADYNQKYFREYSTKVRGLTLKYEGGFNYTGKVKSGLGEYDITVSAMQQMLEKLGIRSPIRLLDKNFLNETEKQRTLVERDYLTTSEIIKEITKLGIRFQENKFKLIYDSNKSEIVGVVGENYNIIPHADVLQSAIRIYGDSIDPRFSYINNKYMRAYFNSDDERLTPITNQKLLFGYSIGNSETGWASLSVRQALTFLQCTNGLELGRIENVTRLYHTIKDLVGKFKKAMEKHLNDKSLLDLIDTWATKPAMYDWGEMKNVESLKKLNDLLSRFGVNKEDYRQKITDIIRKEDRTKPLNSFMIGSAVNNFASNHLDNAVEAQALLSSAYSLMAIQ